MISRFFLNTRTVAMALVFCISPGAVAQEGHPLDGSWSGDRIVDGDKIRVLLTLRLLPDQRFDAMVIERGARIAVNDVTLDPTDWSVNLTVDGQSRNGEPIHYTVTGVIENLGSVNDRWIAGTWRSGADEGEFRVKMN